MRRLLLTLSLLTFTSLLSWGQGGNTVIIRFAGAPTGSCSVVAVAVNNATGEYFDCLSGSWHSVGGTGGGGTVTSVSFTGGLISVATPTTTPAFTVAGTSGGIPYFASTSTWASSGLLTLHALTIGGGAAGAPTPLASLGTSTTVLHGAAAGDPTFGSVVSGDLAASLLLVTPNIGAATGTSLGLGTNPSTGGTLNLPNASTIKFRNAANSNDIQLATLQSDNSWVIGSGAGQGTGQAVNTGLYNTGQSIIVDGQNSRVIVAGNFQTPSVEHVGTKFTTNSGCSETTTVGGSSAGSFASGTTGTCTVVVTKGSGAPTALNGWTCWANDLTTPADTIKQSASTTTTWTLTGTTVSGDVINFGCDAF